MQTCPEVLKEPSKRRCHWTGVPTESRTLVWFQLPESPPTTCQATRPASTATESQQVQERHLLHANRSSREGCRECVHKVDNSPEGQSSENNASGRRRDRTSSSLPSWAATAQGGPGQRSPGPPHPPPGWNAGTLELRGTQTTDKLSYVLVGSNRQTKSPVGLQKGNILPKMGSASFSMFDSR